MNEYSQGSYFGAVAAIQRHLPDLGLLCYDHHLSSICPVSVCVVTHIHLLPVNLEHVLSPSYNHLSPAC